MATVAIATPLSIFSFIASLLMAGSIRCYAQSPQSLPDSVATSRGERIMLADPTGDAVYTVMFYSPYSCYDCSLAIKRWRDSVSSTNRGIVHVTLLPFTKSNVTKRQFLKGAAEFCTEGIITCFDIAGNAVSASDSSALGQWFSAYNMEYAPSMLFIRGEKRIWLSYESMFGDKSVEGVRQHLDQALNLLQRSR